MPMCVEGGREGVSKKMKMEELVNDNNASRDWYALRVFMNKVSKCRDNLIYLNAEIDKDDKQRNSEQFYGELDILAYL